MPSDCFQVLPQWFVGSPLADTVVRVHIRECLNVHKRSLVSAYPSPLPQRTKGGCWVEWLVPLAPPTSVWRTLLDLLNREATVLVIIVPDFLIPPDATPVGSRDRCSLVVAGLQRVVSCWACRRAVSWGRWWGRGQRTVSGGVLFSVVR